MNPYVKNTLSGVRDGFKDFVGYKILSDINFDNLEIYTFELKASNTIDSITKRRSFLRFLRTKI